MPHTLTHLDIFGLFPGQVTVTCHLYLARFLTASLFFSHILSASSFRLPAKNTEVWGVIIPPSNADPCWRSCLTSFTLYIFYCLSVWKCHVYWRMWQFIKEKYDFETTEAHKAHRNNVSHLPKQHLCIVLRNLTDTSLSAPSLSILAFKISSVSAFYPHCYQASTKRTMCSLQTVVFNSEFHLFSPGMERCIEHLNLHLNLMSTDASEHWFHFRFLFSSVYFRCHICCLYPGPSWEASSAGGLIQPLQSNLQLWVAHQPPCAPRLGPGQESQWKDLQWDQH